MAPAPQDAEPRRRSTAPTPKPGGAGSEDLGVSTRIRDRSGGRAVARVFL